MRSPPTSLARRRNAKNPERLIRCGTYPRPFTRSPHTGPTAESLVHTNSVQPQSHRPPRYSPAWRRAGGRQNTTKSPDRRSAWTALSCWIRTACGRRTGRTRRRAAKSTSITLARVSATARASYQRPRRRSTHRREKRKLGGSPLSSRRSVYRPDPPCARANAAPPAGRPRRAASRASAGQAGSRR